MNSKSLLIAIAAFALTTGGAQAYVGSKSLLRAGLTYEQVTALEAARALSQSGETGKARDVLIEAGIDETTLHVLRLVSRSVRADMQSAVAAGDFFAFTKAVKGTEIASVITTEEAFSQLVEAYRLKLEGEHERARNILSELGMPTMMYGGGTTKHHRHGMKNVSGSQREALQVALQANDRETVRAIREEMGMDEGRRGR